MAENQRKQNKDDHAYEAPGDKGAGKEKAARIANARANDRQDPSATGGESPRYEDWSAEELRDRARELGVEGRSDMTKAALIEALRDRQRPCRGWRPRGRSSAKANDVSHAST